MSDQMDHPQGSDNYLKQTYPDFFGKLKDKGLSARTISKLIEDEEITSMAGLKHLGADTIDAMQIPDTQKNILRKVVKDLKPSSVAASGGIEVTGCTLTTGKVDGEAFLASISGAGAGAGIKMEDVKMKTGDIGQTGKVNPCMMNKGGEK